MRTIVLWLVLSALPLSLALAAIEVHFSPNGGCQEAVVHEIRKASQTIDIAMYYLTSRDIAKALVEAMENHVRVRIVMDQSQEIEASSKSGYLIKHGLEIRYHLGFGLMHNKFAVIDGKSLLTGSFNWTRTAEEKNEENMLIITGEPSLIGAYERRFAYLWETSRPDSRNVRGVQAVPAWFCTTWRVFCN